jgi:hypothetical protein
VTTVGAALNQTSNNSMLALCQRLMLAFGAMLLFAACTEGYPKEDELIVNPLALNQSQRLEAMNLLGQEAHPEMTWTYSVLPGCILRTMVSGFETDKPAFNLPMVHADVGISFDKSGQIYSVQVQPRELESLEKRPVLLSKTWLDAIEMSNLVRSFQMGCQTSATAEADDKTD